jgi:hypothetical protein
VGGNSRFDESAAVTRLGQPQLSSDFEAMKTLSLLAAAMLACGTAAYAQTSADTTPNGQLSTPDQAEGGSALMPGDREPHMMKGNASHESRAEVRSEAAAANKARDIPKGEESVKDQDRGGIRQP